MHQYLERQADAVEAVLAAHGVAGRVRGGTLSPRLVHFQLTLPTGVRLVDLGALLPTLAARLDVAAVRLAPDAATGQPTLELPRPDPTPVRLLPLARQVVEVVPPCTATLGVDTAGTPLLIRLDAPEVGAVLVSGDRGAGKSALLRSMALGLGLHNGPEMLRLLLIDVSGPGRRGRTAGTWEGFAALPHLLGAPIRDRHEARLRLHWVLRLLERRSEMATDGEPIEGANLVVLLDGLDDALAGPDGDEIAEAVAGIVRRGREVGVHLVAAMRSARGLERLGWGSRIVGRCAAAADAQAAAGLAGTGAEGLLGAGDFVIVLGGEIARFQSGVAAPDETVRTVGLLADCAAQGAGAAGPARRVAAGGAPAGTLPPEGTWQRARRGPFRLLKIGS